MAIRIVDKKLKDAKQAANATVIAKEAHSEVRGLKTLTVRYTVESDRSTVTKNFVVSQEVYDVHFAGSSIAVLYLKPPEFDPRSSWLESTFLSAESIILPHFQCGFINAVIFLSVSIYLTAPGVSWNDETAPYTCPAPWWGWLVGFTLQIVYIARTLRNLNTPDPEAQFKFAVNFVPGINAWMKASGEHRPEGSPDVELSTMRATQASQLLMDTLTNEPTVLTGTVVKQSSIQPTMLTGVDVVGDLVEEGSKLDGPAASESSENKPLSEQIRDLAALRDQGILTDAEFAAAKIQLLPGSRI
jgi:hypothetical protein